jgi:hypothetical protein
MAESAQQDHKLNVFISCDNLAFADQLDSVLQLTGFGTNIARHGISAGEKWKPRLDRASSPLSRSRCKVGVNS